MDNKANHTDPPQVFRFLPRYRQLAIVAIALGAGIFVAGLLSVLPSSPAVLATGVVGVFLGSAYLLSPAWKIQASVDSLGIVVTKKSELRFRLAWEQVTKVVAAPSTHTCYVTSGDPSQSLLVPGIGAPAPYDIQHKKQLYGLILRYISSDKVIVVDSLESYANGNKKNTAAAQTLKNT